jgi:hypothetical protein
MLMCRGKKIWMQGNDRSMMLREMRRQRRLTFEPIQTLPWPIDIRDHPRHKRLIQPNHQGMPVLQNIASVRNHPIATRSSDSSFNTGVHGRDIDKNSELGTTKNTKHTKKIKNGIVG